MRGEGYRWRLWSEGLKVSTDLCVCVCVCVCVRSKHPLCVSSPGGGWIMWASDSRKTTELFSPHYSGAGCLEGSLKSNGFLYPRRKLWPAKLVTHWLTETSRKIHKIHLTVPLEKEQDMSQFVLLWAMLYPTRNTIDTCSDVSSGAVLVSTTSKECRDSDVDLDVDGDDTLEYGRAQYPLRWTHEFHRPLCWGEVSYMFLNR